MSQEPGSTLMFCKLGFNFGLLQPKRTVKNKTTGTSLVVQWIKPMQGTPVQALTWEDPTCLGASKPVGPNN